MSFVTRDTSEQQRGGIKTLTTPLLERIALLYTEQRVHSDAESGVEVYEATCRAQDLAALFCDVVPGSTRNSLMKQLPGCYVIEESCEAGYSAWAGLGVRDLAREFRGEANTLQEFFERARKELARTGLKESLEEASVGMRKKRRRAVSEHDGDFNLDRKWDITPFDTTLMAKKEFPYIEICFPMTMTQHASREDLSSFTAKCLALAEVLEGAGYRIAITGESWHLMKTINGEERNELVRYRIREANEYGDIQSLATYASCEFFRRVMFLFSRGCSHIVHGLSNPSSQPSGVGGTVDTRWIPAEPGQLVLDQDTVAKLFSCKPDQVLDLFRARLTNTIQNKALTA
jgi:hypothetical protein